MRNLTILLIIFSTIFLACNKDDDLQELTVITTNEPSDTTKTVVDTTQIVTNDCPIKNDYAFDTLDFNAVNFSMKTLVLKPTVEISVWKLEHYSSDYSSQGSTSTATLLEGGNCTSTTSICQQFEDTVASTGIRKSCFITGCDYYYVKYLEKDIIHTIIDSTNTIDFLGEINTSDEALLLLYVKDYNFDKKDVTMGSIKEVGNGYEVRAYKEVGGCGKPLVKSSYHLHVCSLGQVTILSSKVVSSKVGPCF